MNQEKIMNIYFESEDDIVTVICNLCGKKYTYEPAYCEDPSDEDCPYCGASINGGY